MASVISLIKVGMVSEYDPVQCQRSQFVETVIARGAARRRGTACPPVYTESAITDSSGRPNSPEWTLD